jgi:prepilin-type N-terminal cleavage/methylation domain-containing protein
MKRGGQRGFSLMELMIAVGIILVILTMVIPNLTAARVRTNEVSAIRTIGSIHTAQAQYQSQTNRYAVALPELSKVMSKKLADGIHSGYKFVVQGTNEGYQIVATPEKVGSTGNRTFVSDQTLSVQDSDGKEVEN